MSLTSCWVRLEAEYPVDAHLAYINGPFNMMAEILEEPTHVRSDLWDGNISRERLRSPGGASSLGSVVRCHQWYRLACARVDVTVDAAERFNLQSSPFTIECQGQRSVVALNLQGLGLSGSFPSSSWPDLPQLTALRLEGNPKLGGGLPESMGSLLQLLWLSTWGTSITACSELQQPQEQQLEQRQVSVCTLPEFLQFTPLIDISASVSCPYVELRSFEAYTQGDELSVDSKGQATCQPAPSSPSNNERHENWTITIVLVAVLPLLAVALGMYLFVKHKATIHHFIKQRERMRQQKRSRIPGTPSVALANGTGILSLSDVMVTWVFTDVADSTKLWEWNPNVMDGAIDLHNTTMRSMLDDLCGHEIRNEGDSFALAFHEAADAVDFCLKWPKALLEHTSGCAITIGNLMLSGATAGNPSTVVLAGLKVRMGISTGVPDDVFIHEHTDLVDYHGMEYDLAAEICDLAAGGQILLGPKTFQWWNKLHVDAADAFANLSTEAATTLEHHPIRPLSVNGSSRHSHRNSSSNHDRRAPRANGLPPLLANLAQAVVPEISVEAMSVSNATLPSGFSSSDTRLMPRDLQCHHDPFMMLEGRTSPSQPSQPLAIEGGSVTSVASVGRRQSLAGRRSLWSTTAYDAVSRSANCGANLMGNPMTVSASSGSFVMQRPGATSGTLQGVANPRSKSYSLMEVDSWPPSNTSDHNSAGGVTQQGESACLSTPFGAGLHFGSPTQRNDSHRRRLSSGPSGPPGASPPFGIGFQIGSPRVLDSSRKGTLATVRELLSLSSINSRPSPSHGSDAAGKERAGADSAGPTALTWAGMNVSIPRRSSGQLTSTSSFSPLSTTHSLNPLNTGSSLNQLAPTRSLRRTPTGGSFSRLTPTRSLSLTPHSSNPLAPTRSLLHLSSHSSSHGQPPASVFNRSSLPHEHLTGSGRLSQPQPASLNPAQPALAQPRQPQPHTPNNGSNSVRIDLGPSMLASQDSSNQPPPTGLYSSKDSSNQPLPTGMYSSKDSSNQPLPTGMYGSKDSSNQQPPTGMYGSKDSSNQPLPTGMYGSKDSSNQQPPTGTNSSKDSSNLLLTAGMYSSKSVNNPRQLCLTIPAIQVIATLIF
eukprot:gene13869-19794_t